MTKVIAAAPIGVPVYRMEAELLCRDLNSAAHRSVEQLQQTDAAREQIAALLGLRFDQLAAVEAQLDGTAGMRVRTLLVWVEPAHGAVLSHDDGLDLVAPGRTPDIPLLVVPPPSAGELPTHRFTRAASTRGATRERIVVDEVRALRADVRGAGRPRGGRSSEHLLLLPDTWLVVRARPGGPAVEVHRGELYDEPLTAIARATLLDGGRLRPQQLPEDEDACLRPEQLTADAADAALARLHGALGTQPSEVFDDLSLEPAMVQERLYEEVARADEQLVVICDIEERALPFWMREAIEGARQRDVRCIVRSTGKRGEGGPTPGAGIVVVRDRVRALAHSDAMPLGAPWELHTLAGQACLSVHDPQAVARVLERLDVPSPPPARPRKPSEPLADVAARGLHIALESLRGELPPGTPVVLVEDDERSFCEQAERNPINLRDEEELAKLGRGMVWERILAAACHALEKRHEQLVVDGVRLAFPAESIDLDVVMRNVEHRVWWILDAKCKKGPTGRDIRMMERQLEVVAQQRCVPDGYEARGATVYPSYARDVFEPTTDDRIVRWRLGDLERGLLEQPPPLG